MEIFFGEDCHEEAYEVGDVNGLNEGFAVAEDRDEGKAGELEEFGP